MFAEFNGLYSVFASHLKHRNSSARHSMLALTILVFLVVARLRADGYLFEDVQRVRVTIMYVQVVYHRACTSCVHFATLTAQPTKEERDSLDHNEFHFRALKIAIGLENGSDTNKNPIKPAD